VVSADSMQVYRGMDIGTAKVPVQERRVPYHCIDLADPGQPYSAALFQHDARAAIESIHERGKRAVLCGGTGLYVRAVLDEMDFAAGEQVGNKVRDEYTALAEQIGADALHDLLRERDPESAELIHPNNVRRVIRAFEMLEEGDSYAKRKKAFKTIEPHLPSVKIALQVDVDVLNARINARVDKMAHEGLVDEVKALLDAGFREGLTAPQAIGYKEIVAYLDGTCSLAEALESIKQSTRRYAKRQRTWLRSDKNNIWIEANEGITEEVLQKALTTIRSNPF